MSFFQIILWILISTISFTEQVEMQCSTSFMTGNNTNLCYYYRKRSLPWVEAYNHCLSRTTDGILLQIFSNEQFQLVKNVNIDQTSLFWLGANNFASFRDSHWHWLDGSIVDSSVVDWCPNSTYRTAIGTHCAAYDSIAQCVNNYQCDTLLPAPCVSISNGVSFQSKVVLTPRLAAYICSAASGTTMYGNWWTYSVLLLNWFVLFCFFLYLCNRFIINKPTITISTIIVILSFILMMIYAILWGVQYNDIIQIPLAIVIIGSLACTFLLIVLLLILNNRTRVHRYMPVMIIVLLTIVVESFLSLGIILCIAYCSGYITLAASSIEKDIVASLLGSLNVAMSIMFFISILHLLDVDGNDRVHAMRSDHAPAPSNVPLANRPVVAPARLEPPPPVTTANHNLTPVHPKKKVEYIHRSTSPVDERVLQEFYSDQPKDVHQYSLEGRNYVVYEGVNLNDVDSYKKELTSAMLLQEPQGLREAIDRAKSSIHASNLAEEIQQAQSLAAKLT